MEPDFEDRGNQMQGSPYTCHVFVCTNDRQGSRKSCADGDGGVIRAELKARIADAGWRPRVRVSSAGCLGLCEEGPNVIVYPQGYWFQRCTMERVPEILSCIEAILAENDGV